MSGTIEELEQQLRQLRAVKNAEIKSIKLAQREAKETKQAQRQLKENVTRKHALHLWALHNLSYVAIGKLTGCASATARNRAGKARRYYMRRRSVPAFHDLEGDTWQAQNCDERGEWFTHYWFNHPDTHRLYRFIDLSGDKLLREQRSGQ